MANEPHPRQFRRSILKIAVVAMATWWGLGLPYSLFGWLLDPTQLRWVLICYAWEVPFCGLVGPLLFPFLWWRRIEARWDETVRSGEEIDPARAAALERVLLDFPVRVGGIILLTSLLGYAVGGLQVRVFAQTPLTELVKIGALGLVTGLVGGLFAFLYLESLLEPLLRRLATVAPAVQPTGRRMPLYVKVFACSIIMTVMALLVLGATLYSRTERVLEEELGQRALGDVRQLAIEIADRVPGRLPDVPWWRQQAVELRLGPSGFVHLVDADGTVLAGDTTAQRLADERFRPTVTRTILTASDGYLVDRVYRPHVVAFATLPDSRRRVVAVLDRGDFAAELNGMLQRGAVVFFGGLALALVQGLLFSRRLSRPIEVLTAMASRITHSPGGPWETVPVRTNDEVGELAVAFNQMMERLEEARAGLERRVAEATRTITTLYEVARTTSSTLEIEDVLALIADKTLSTLGLPRLILLWRPPDPDGVVDAFVAARGMRGERLDLAPEITLETLCPAPRQPEIVFASVLPETISARLDAERVLRLPLVFKGELPGVIVAAIDGAGEPDRALAAALASQAATALANASLFETVRRKEAELRKLSEMRADLQEESLRTMSRELHDGIAQVLTVVNMDLGVLERAPHPDPAALQARVHEVREQLTSLLQEVRTMSQVLRPSMLDFGLIPTLHWFVEKFTARTGLRVDLRTPPEETRLPPGIELMLYRVTQEALTNVAKHAQARRVEVELTVRPEEQVVLVVADDGVGFEADRFRRRPALAGVGLLGMRERAAFHHGTIDIRSRPNAGVRITLRVPLAADGAASRLVG